MIGNVFVWVIFFICYGLYVLFILIIWKGYCWVFMFDVSGFFLFLVLVSVDDFNRLLM